MRRRLAALAVAVLAALATLPSCGGGGVGGSAAVVVPAVPARTPSKDPFDRTVLHYVDLTVAPDALAGLVPGAGDYVPCDVVFDATAVAQVGLRIKGTSTLRPVGDKPSWTIKANEFVKATRLFGLRRLHLHNEVLDPGFLCEHLAYRIFARAGTPVRRSAFARVTLNGRYLGVYLVAEAYDTTFLKDRFGSDAGNLYEGVVGVDVTDPDGLELDTNEDENDRADLRAVAAVVTGSPDATLPADLEAVLDLEGFLTYLAVEALVVHWDGYGARNVLGGSAPPVPNNWYAYNVPGDGRFVWIAHGTDLCFLERGADVLEIPPPTAALARRVLLHPDLAARYVARLRQLLDTAWDVPGLLAELDAAVATIHGSVVEGDTSATFDLGGFLHRVESMRTFVRKRPEIVQSQLGW